MTIINPEIQQQSTKMMQTLLFMKGFTDGHIVVTGRDCQKKKCCDSKESNKKYLTSTGIKPLMVQMIKHLPAMQETQVRSLGWEDPLEKGMATHSIILAWRTPWTEEPGGLQYLESQRVVPRSILKCETVLGTLDATPKVPQHTGLT